MVSSAQTYITSFDFDDMIFLSFFEFNHQKIIIDLIFQVDHPNVVKLLGACTDRRGPVSHSSWNIHFIGISYFDFRINLTLLKEKIQKECLIHSETCHRCVIKSKSKFYSEAGAYFEHLSNFLSKVYIVMEFAKHGSLRNYLRR